MSRNQMPWSNPLPVEPSRAEGVDDISENWMTWDSNLASSNWVQMDAWDEAMASESNFVDQVSKPIGANDVDMDIVSLHPIVHHGV
jgi:hypothetical protein